MTGEKVNQVSVDDSDRRVRLAGERTLLAYERMQNAWVRTALTLISFSFAIFECFTYLLTLLVALFPALTLALEGDQLRPNKSQQSDLLDIRPSVLKQNLSPHRSPPEAPSDAVVRLETKLEQAKRDAKGAEGLCKSGVLSNAEMEQRLLKVIQREAELANARLADAKQKAAELESAVASGQSAKDQLASAKAALKQLSEAAAAATAKRTRAELEAAEANVRRQQQLLKRGVAAKSDVDHAQEKLAELKAQEN